MQIKNAKHKGVAAILASDNPAKAKGINPKIAGKIHNQITALKAAATIRELADSFPGWRVHDLKPGRPGVWSMWVTGNYRLTFRLDQKEGVVSDLDLEDYH